MKWRITSTSLSSGRCSSFRSSSSGRSTFSAVGTCSVFLLFRSNNVFIFPLYENPWNCQRQHDPLMVGPYDRCNRSGFFCFFQGMGGFQCIFPFISPIERFVRTVQYPLRCSFPCSRATIDDRAAPILRESLFFPRHRLVLQSL